MLLFLLACNNPISNAAITADEDFLEALPGSNRLAFPQHFRERPTGGDEEFLEVAGRAADDLDALLAPFVFVGDVLRSTEPSERSASHRLFDARTISSPDGALQPSWWVRANLTRAGEFADILWTIEGALAPEGPWTTLAQGRHATDGVGSMTWYAPEMATLLGIDVPVDRLEVDYTDARDGSPREVVLRLPEAYGFPVEYAFYDEVGFQFPLEDALGTEAPAILVMVNLPDRRGRVDGVLFLDEERPFTTCWDASGDRVYASGTAGLPEIGTEGACPTL